MSGQGHVVSSFALCPFHLQATIQIAGGMSRRLAYGDVSASFMHQGPNAPLVAVFRFEGNAGKA